MTDHDETAGTELLPLRAAAPVPLLPSEHESQRLWKLALAISATEFVPKSLRGNPPAIMAAMLTGRELGIHPMRALRQVNVIDGKPSPAPELMLALALKAGHDVDVVETTRERCVVEVRRADWPEDRVRQMVWTLEDAVDAGLCTVDPETGKAVARSKYGAPLPWQQYTRAMLRARCLAEACRTWLPDVVEGHSYMPEELGATVDGRAHALELVEAAHERGEEYDPLEGVPEEIRAQVGTIMPDLGEDEGHDDEPTVGPDGVIVLDPQPTPEPQPEPQPDPADDLAVDRAADNAEADQPAEPGLLSLVNRLYGKMSAVEIDLLLRNGRVRVGSDETGEEITLPLPVPQEVLRLLHRLETARDEKPGRQTSRKLVWQALNRAGLRLPTAEEKEQAQTAPSAPESPAAAQTTENPSEGDNGPQGVSGAQAQPDLPSEDTLENRRELLRRWKRAHRDLEAAAPEAARRELSRRMGVGAAADESWAARIAWDDLVTLVRAVEGARAEAIPF